MQVEDESTRAAHLAVQQLQTRLKKRKKEKRDDNTRNSTPPSPSRFVAPELDNDFASFTQHTTGFGLKMLQKYGFTRRLGKNEQGIVNPIIAKVRPKGMGLGCEDAKQTEGEEFTRNALEKQKNAKAKQQEKTRETKSAIADMYTAASQWKRSKKHKTTYKTVDEVLAERYINEKDHVQVILDMRGPHVKVTSLDKITTSITTDLGWMSSTSTSTSTQTLPELQHNVFLLVQLIETDIHRLNRELKHAKDTMTNLENERDELETRVIQEENAIRRTEECLAVIEQLQETLKCIASLGNCLSARFDAIAAFIDTIHHHYPHETRIYHLSTYAFTLVTALFNALFHTWEPLQLIPSSTTSTSTTKHILEILQRWKMLLSSCEISSRLSITSPSSDDLYGRILHELLLPKLQLCISTQWIPRDQQQSHLLTSLLSSLHPILPSDMYHQLIATLILPKLKNTIDIWNPRTDAIPIHTWIEPWSAVIPQQLMRPLYHIIHTKLAIVLQAWHPADTSALTVISPWLRVWSSHDVDQFLTRSIIPKLTSMLATDLVINPKAQVVTPFTQLMSWQPVMPSRMMIHILYEYFFPKWLTALTTWLSSDPDLEQVSKWYLGWKHLFPQSLRELPAIKLIFNKSLDLMNYALQGMPLESWMQQIYAILQNQLQSQRTTTTTSTTSVGSSPTELARIAAEEHARAERTRVPQQREREAAEEVDNMPIKEVMSSYATLNQLEFVPNLKRGLQDGKQVYLFGKVSVYTNGQNIYAYDPTTSTWSPISLPELLTHAQNMANK